MFFTLFRQGRELSKAILPFNKVYFVAGCGSLRPVTTPCNAGDDLSPFHGIPPGDNEMKPLNRCTALALIATLSLAPYDSTVSAEQIALQVAATHPTMLSGEKQTNYVRISLTGFEIPETKSRPPVNVALVIDTSGSMSGQKILQARDAAIAAVKRLRNDDIVSVRFV